MSHGECGMSTAASRLPSKAASHALCAAAVVLGDDDAVVVRAMASRVRLAMSASESARTRLGERV